MIKLCECGCGLPAPIATKKCTRDNMVKGRPMSRIRGHAMGKYEIDRSIRAAKDLACRQRYAIEQKARLRNHVDAYLKEHPCVDCGFDNPIALDFDHREPKEKYKTISQIIHGRLGINLLTTEIAKCDVRCANCHRIRHYTETH